MRAASVDDVRALYLEWGGERYDEALSQLAHALQTAALAERDGAPDHLVAAALLHDVGHLLELRAGRVADGPRDRRHEATGARYLSELFGPDVIGPIRLHVVAKRYLCAVDPQYRASLSAGSVRSLALQGGPMGEDDRSEFEARPNVADAVALRRWDDLGKVDGLDVGGFDRHLPRLERLADGWSVRRTGGTAPRDP